MREILLLLDKSEPSGSEWFLTFVGRIKHTVHEETIQKPDDLIDLVNEVNVERKDMILKFGEEKYIPNLPYADAVLRYRHSDMRRHFFRVDLIIDRKEVESPNVQVCSFPRDIFDGIFGEPREGDALAVFVTDYKTHPTAQSLVKLSHAYKKRLYKEE